MGEIENRIRAARGYAGLSQKALAERLQVHEQTVKRMEAGRRPLAPKRQELLGISEACGVPMWFFERGWAGPPADEIVSDYPDPELATEVLRRGLERLGLEEGIDANESGQGAG